MMNNMLRGFLSSQRYKDYPCPELRSIR